MRQKTRRLIIYISLFLFPLVLNYLSPAVSQMGAFHGIIAGSVLVFAFQFVTGLFFGRAWCGWVCPVAGLSELGATIKNKPVNRKKLAVVRYIIFGVWLLILVLGFVLAGGIKGVVPLYMTERLVSIDEPTKFINYYMVLAILFVLTLALGRRGACHSVCWMAPFMTAGTLVGRALHLPQLTIRSDPERCVDCGLCTKKCPMSIEVHRDMKAGLIKTTDCIRCGECVDTCPKKVLKYSFDHRRAEVKK